MCHARRQLCYFGLRNGMEYSSRAGLFQDSWCLGSLPCQIITGHCITNVGKTGQCLPWKRISNNSVISRKDSKGTCILMFPRNNSALNGFHDSKVALGFSLEGRFVGVTDLRQTDLSYASFYILPWRPHFMCLLKYSVAYSIFMYTILLCFDLLRSHQEILPDPCDPITMTS